MSIRETRIERVVGGSAVRGWVGVCVCVCVCVCGWVRGAWVRGWFGKEVVGGDEPAKERQGREDWKNQGEEGRNTDAIRGQSCCEKCTSSRV
jgi:hypothetical protein